MHSNPLFYKYYWWIFHAGSACEGWGFLTARHRLCTQDAIKLMDRLRAEGKSYCLYNTRLYRNDPDNTPWDYAAPRLKNEDLAPAFAEHRKCTRLHSSHYCAYLMPSPA